MSRSPKFPTNHPRVGKEGDNDLFFYLYMIFNVLRKGEGYI